MFNFNLTPKEAVEFFNAKKAIPTERWDELAKEAHATAFTVARSVGYDIVSDIFSSLQEAQKNGVPFKEWEKSITPTLEKKGWTGFRENADGTKTELGTPRRLKTVYETNVWSAYNAGEYKQNLTNAKNRPYWMYNAKNDGLTRPAHRALDGKVFRYDDPIWQYIYPPNGYNCRCTVIALNESDVLEMGLKVEKSPEPYTVESVNPKTGEVYKTTAFDFKNEDGTAFTFKPDVGFDKPPINTLETVQTLAYQKAAKLLELCRDYSFSEESPCSALAAFKKELKESARLLDKEKYAEFATTAYNAILEINNIKRLAKETKTQEEVLRLKQLEGAKYKALHKALPTNVLAGTLSVGIFNYYKNKLDITLKSPFIHADIKSFTHAERLTKQELSKSITLEDFITAYNVINNPNSKKFYDKDNKTVVYLLENGNSKIVVKVDYAKNTNRILTAGEINEYDLLNKEQFDEIVE